MLLQHNMATCILRSWLSINNIHKTNKVYWFQILIESLLINSLCRFFAHDSDVGELCLLVNSVMLYIASSYNLAFILKTINDSWIDNISFRHHRFHSSEKRSTLNFNFLTKLQLSNVFSLFVILLPKVPIRSRSNFFPRFAGQVVAIGPCIAKEAFANNFVVTQTNRKQVLPSW